jgi:hypothetical protein
MRKSAFTTIRRTRTSAKAGRLVGLLRNAGLHPVDMPLSAPLALPGNHPTFPVQVPSEEASAAEQVLNSVIDEESSRQVCP